MEKASLTLATGSLAAGALQNLFDNDPDSWASFTHAGGIVLFNVDMGAVVTADQFAMRFYDYNTDYDSGTQAIAILTDDNDNGAYSATTQVAGVAIDNTVGTPVYMPFTSFTSSTKRYWQIAFGNITMTLKIANLFLLRKRSITIGNVWPQNDAKAYESRVIHGPGGRDMVSIVNRNAQRIIPRKWLFSGSTNWTALQAAFDDSKGCAFPLILAEGSNRYLVRITNDTLSESQRDYLVYEPSLQLNEIPYVEDGENY